MLLTRALWRASHQKCKKVKTFPKFPPRFLINLLIYNMKHLNDPKVFESHFLYKMAEKETTTSTESLESARNSNPTMYIVLGFMKPFWDLSSSQLVMGFGFNRKSEFPNCSSGMSSVDQQWIESKFLKNLRKNLVKTRGFFRFFWSF